MSEKSKDRLCDPVLGPILRRRTLSTILLWLRRRKIFENGASRNLQSGITQPILQLVWNIWTVGDGVVTIWGMKFNH